MRALTMLCLCVVLAGCATSRRTGDSEISRSDLAMFNKTFEGTVVDIETVDYTRTVPQPWWSFSPGKVSGTCLRFKVRNLAGKARIFYDYSEDQKRIKELRGYYFDLARGASVVVCLGPMDENKPETVFDSVSLKTQ